MNSFFSELSRSPALVWEAVKNSWISIVIILLVFALTLLDQSDTVVITLLDNDPVSLALFFALLIALSLVVIHYPIYMEFRRKNNGDEKELVWTMLESWQFLGLGFIEFVQKRGLSYFLKFFRNFLGLLLLTMVYYVVGNVHHRTVRQISLLNEEEFFYSPSYSSYAPVWLFFFFFLLLLIGMIFPCSWIVPLRQRVRSFFCRFRPDKPALALFRGAALLFCLASVITLISSVRTGWSAFTFYAFSVTMWCLGLALLVFSVYRRRCILPFSFVYLKMIAVSGWISVMLILFAHFAPLKLNVLVLFLAYFHVFYGLNIISIKHYLYYRQYDTGQVKAHFKSKLKGGKRLAYLLFSWVYPLVLPFVVLYLLSFHFVVGNNLHLLEGVSQETAQEKGELVDYVDYLSAIESHFSDKEAVFFIASYGGGVKASVWNLMVLKQLDSLGILDRTVAMSGVSGGTIGQALYGGYVKESEGVTSENIKSLSGKNMVGIDFTYLFGRDLIFGQLPDGILKVLRVKDDRAKRAMKEYAYSVSADSNMLNKTFQQYWSELFRERREEGKWFPALIWNSAGSQIQRGVSFSVALPDTIRLDHIFYDSADLANTGSSALAYLHAASTSDRFPVFSPTAKVEGKGYFLDGGYFENSGLLSLWDLYENLKRNKVLDGKQVYFIQIANDPNVYLRELVKAQSPEVRVEVAPEFGSILKTVTSIGFVPSYLNRRFESGKIPGICYCQVQLPYLIRAGDLKSLNGGEVIGSDSIGRALVRQSNERLLRDLKKDPYAFARPPLARLLGRQAHHYMDQYLKGSMDSCLKVIDKRAYQISTSP